MDRRPISEVTSAVSDTYRSVHLSYQSGRTRPVDWRLGQLRRLERFLIREQDAICLALAEDLGRTYMEAWTADIATVLAEIRVAVRELRDWTKPRSVPVPLLLKPSTARVYWEPRGVVLIIGPWNYPFQLLLSPLVGALAAGNCAVLKPSEQAPASSALMAEKLPLYLDFTAVQVVEGGVDVSQALLQQPFDHVFFTGGTAVGRIVMEAAARNLAPVTLELGGKSPCLVDGTIEMDLAARRIVSGKFINAGQTCVAPDYVLVEERVADRFIDQVVDTIRLFYGSNPNESPDYARIVNDRHVQRLKALLEGVPVIHGGRVDEEQRYIEPTVVYNPPLDSPLMDSEIFGPILPVIPVEDMERAVALVARLPDPLALYLFSADSKVHERVRLGTRSGNLCINDTVVQVMVPHLPFGGLGPSGMGAYHGRAGFETFSHRRSVLSRSTLLDPFIRYPPYTNQKVKWWKKLVVGSL